MFGWCFIHPCAYVNSVVTLYLSCLQLHDTFILLFLICMHYIFAYIIYRYDRSMTQRSEQRYRSRARRQCIGERIQKMGGPREYMSGKRCLPSEYHLTNTNAVLNPRQALEHSKHPTSLLKYTWVYTLYCALSIGVQLKPIVACLTLSTIYIHVSLLVCIGHSMLSYA